jgi:ABC-type nitrate/sulfonate/bicarbonate transport system permease component
VRARIAALYALLLAAWQAASSLAGRAWFPGPLDITLAFLDPAFTSQLAKAYLLTAMRALAGFTIGLVAGVGLGLAAGAYRYTSSVLEGIASIAASVPSVAWIPLLIAAMGVDEFRLPVAVSFLCSFPPILYQTLNALRSLDPEELLVARTLGARGLYLWRTIILPAVVERVFPAVKIEAAMVWKTVFAAEMVAVPSGLGYTAMVYADLLDVTHVAAVVAILALTVVGIVHLVSLAERRVLARRGLGVEPWQSVLEL